MSRRWIFFDAVGTLFAIRGSVGGQYARVASRFGCGATAAQIDLAFRRHFQAASPLAVSREKTEKEALRREEFEWWRTLAANVFDEMGGIANFNRCFEELHYLLGTAACWEPYPEVPGLLKLMRHSGFGIGVISNFDSRLVFLLQDLGLATWIDQVIYSTDSRAAKPDPAIFHTACKRSRCAPEDAWHVGDSLADDYQGASRAGLKAVLVDRRNRHTRHQGLKVRRLSQLPAMLSDRGR